MRKPVSPQPTQKMGLQSNKTAHDDDDAELTRMRGDLLLLKRERRELQRRLKEADELTGANRLSVQQRTRRMGRHLSTGQSREQTISADASDPCGLGDSIWTWGGVQRATSLTSAQVIAGTCVGIASIKGIQDVAFDLCIVDEASKATPTEVLVLSSRSRRWILVGDQKQLPPFVDQELDEKEVLGKYGLTNVELSKTLFDRLHELLPRCSKAALTLQYRDG